MNTVPSVAAEQATAPRLERSRAIHTADFLLPASLTLCGIGLALTNTASLGPYGLIPELPLVYYAGVALLIASSAAELSRRQISKPRMVLHTVALVAILYGTAPLLYPEARYSWVYKTVGVVQYVNAYGHLNTAIDIYQNWPGFFALAGWFTKVAGLGTPLAFAKWAQLFYELAALPLLYLIYRALRLPTRHRWLAILLYSASNWVGQDYLSPQATGTLLSLGIMAIAMHWMYARSTARPPGRLLPGRLIRNQDSGTKPSPLPRNLSVPIIAATLVIFAVLTFTHQLSPYMVTTQLGVLAVFGMLRPRWLPVAMAAIAGGYLMLRWSFVSSHFDLFKAIGDIFSNVSPPSFNRGASPSQHVIEWCSEALSVGIWVVAALGAWRARRAGRGVLHMVLLAYSPILLLIVLAYGNEGILRVFLFSLPWAAALVTYALLPVRPRQANVNGQPIEADHFQPQFDLGRGRAALRVSIGLAVVLALFFPAFFGDDGMNVMPQSEVKTITAFLQHHNPVGVIYVAIGHGPFADTARYYQFPLRPIFGAHGLLTRRSFPRVPATTLARDAARRHTPSSHRSAYVIVAPTMQAYSSAYLTTPDSNFVALLRSLRRSRYWQLISNRDGTYIYGIRPKTADSLVPVHRP